MKKHIYILSTKAGNHKAIHFKNQLIHLYKKHQLDDRLEILVTQDTQSIASWAKEASQEKALVTICGGDGSLNEASKELVYSSTPLGLIPAGTGNDFSKNFAYEDFQLEDLLQPKVYPIDAIEVNGRVALNVVSMGMDSHVLSQAIHLINRYSLPGKLAYLAAAVQEIIRMKTTKLSMDLELASGERLVRSGAYTLTVLCNGSFYGNGFNPSPHSQINDGVLELVLAKEMKRLEALSLLSAYAKGQHIDHEKVEILKVVSGRIRGAEEFVANEDGEVFTSQELSFRVLPASVLWAESAKLIAK